MKKYEIIYADPPWAYRQKQINFQSYDNGKKYENCVTDHYRTMSNADIAELPVASIAADDALLFLWATSPNLDIAIDVGRAWGFDFKTVAFVWEKQRTNYGFYTLSSTELCLVFKRGRIPKKATHVRQFLSEKLGPHSRKPDEIRRRIEAMFPHARKIELFARPPATRGWDVWGNEVKSSIELPTKE